MATPQIAAPPLASTAVDFHTPKRRVKWGPVVRHAILLLFVAVVTLPLAWVLLPR